MAILFLGSVDSQSLFVFFLFGGGGVYITSEFDRLLHRGNTKILTAKFVSLGDVFILQFSKLIKAFP